MHAPVSCAFAPVRGVCQGKADEGEAARVDEEALPEVEGGELPLHGDWPATEAGGLALFGELVVF